MHDDTKKWIFVGGVLVLLAGVTTVGQLLKRQPNTGLNPAMIDTFNRRIRAWWLLLALLAGALFFSPWVTVLLFFFLSFWALREFITLTPTRLGDHRALFWVFVLFTPLQYVLVGLGQSYYPFYSILIPVYGILFIPARVAFSGDPKRFLERTAKIQAGLIVCVYCLSFAPALLDLKLVRHPAGAVGGPVHDWTQNPVLLFYLVFMVQVSDALQYGWGKMLGKRVIAPAISPNRTWEGFLGGVGSTALLGALLWWATPFSQWQSAGMALVIALMGFAGGMTMSAIKRDRGVKDYGTLVAGHGGVLDRVDSLCFAAPVFFHLTKLLFTREM
ncbi:MAG: phosphatidate cytidylyltransferase [Planctomycetia bacterium]|nr:phosphatidate cytidylyltransferase [Planctomycetia bacterium]